VSVPLRGVALIGPTASGKSAIAHELALELGDVEIATVDSMTVYREMDIATAKPTRGQRAAVRYHLLDLVDPAEEFAVAEFQRAARAAAADVAARRRRLVHVGGTGLYGRAVIDDLEIPPQFPELRAQLEQRAISDLAAMYRELEVEDPVAASRMEPTNARRIVRALEVTRGSGRAFSSFGPGLRHYGEASMAQVGLTVDLEMLDESIELRFRQWMDQGLLDEVVRLSERPGGLSRTARQAVGYRELLAHVEGGEPLSACVDAAITATRRLARRQRSWFARDPRIEWVSSADEARQRVRTLLASLVRE
jgi:tRNA dimethylallyltransferase